jgi:hypothetical protein
MSRKNKPKGRKKNIYPLPDRIVLYNHKKHMKPIPEVGKKYHCFDDGKITFSRHYIVEVGEALGQMAFKRKYPNVFKRWLIESKSHYWLFSRTTDKFVVRHTDNEIDDFVEVFVRTKQGGWFSITYPSWLGGGKLDVTGKLWNNLVSRIDDFDYTNEEKIQILKENII